MGIYADHISSKKTKSQYYESSGDSNSSPSVGDMLVAGDVGGIAKKAIYGMGSSAFGQGMSKEYVDNAEQHTTGYDGNGVDTNTGTFMVNGSLGPAVSDAATKIYNEDIKPGIIDPFVTGAKQAINELGRSQVAYDDIISNPESTFGDWKGGAERLAGAGYNTLKSGPLALIPQVAAGTFAVDVAKEAIEHGFGSAARLATYGQLVDTVSDPEFGQKFNDRPITTTGEVALSALPLIGAGFGARAGFRGARNIHENYKGGFDQAVDNIGKNYAAGSDYAASGLIPETVHYGSPKSTVPKPSTESVTPSSPSVPQVSQLQTGINPTIDSYVSAAAVKTGVDPNLLAKLVDQESTYGRDPNAGGNLAQVSNDVAGKYGLDPNNPAQSIEAGARYLKEQMDANGGDVREALAAYNAGPGNKAAGYGYADSVLGREIGGETRSTATGGAMDAGEQAWLGQEMPNGASGCVDAVVRVGSYHDSFLAEEAKKGVSHVPTLVADAGDRVIPFDPARLEKGDVIVYGDNNHVVLYDGNGGYVGNSTGLKRVVHGVDYREMGNQVPTKIIKTAERPGSNSNIEEYWNKDGEVKTEPVEEYWNKDSASTETTDFGNFRETEDIPNNVRDSANGETEFRPIDDLNRSDDTIVDKTPAAEEAIRSEIEKGMSGREMESDTAGAPIITRETIDTMMQNGGKLTPEQPTSMRHTEAAIDYATSNGVYHTFKPETPAGEKAWRQQRKAELESKSGVKITPEQDVQLNKLDDHIDSLYHKLADAYDNKYDVIAEKYASEYRSGGDTYNSMVSADKDIKMIRTEINNAERYRSEQYGGSIPLEAIKNESDIYNNRGLQIPYDYNSVGKDREIVVDSANHDVTPGEPYMGSVVSRQEILADANKAFPAVGDIKKYIKTEQDSSGVSIKQNTHELNNSKPYSNYDNLHHDLADTLDRNYKITSHVVPKWDSELGIVTTGRNYVQIHAQRVAAMHKALASYVKDPVATQEIMPNVYRMIDNTISATDKAKINAIRRKIQMFDQQPAGAKIKGTIAEEPKATIKDKISTGGRELYRKMVDKLDPIHQAEKMIEEITGHKISVDRSAYAAARMCSDKVNGIAAEIINGKDGEKIVRDLNKRYGANTVKYDVTLRDVIDQLGYIKDEGFLRAHGLHDYQEALSEYLVAQRMLELKRIKGDDFHTPLSVQEYADYISHAPELLRSAAADIYKINDNILRIATREGLIKRETYEHLRETQPHYVPLGREFLGDDATMISQISEGKSSTDIGSPVSKIEGSKADTKDPLRTTAANIIRILDITEKNKVARKLADNAQMTGVEGLVERVRDESHKNEASFTVWRNGYREVYNTTPEVYNAMQMLTPDGANIIVDLVANMPARIVRATATQHNPFFALTNVLRDQVSAGIVSDYGYKPFLDFGRGIYHWLKKDELWDEFKGSGISNSTLINADRDFARNIMNDVNPSTRKKIFDTINIPAHILHGTEWMGNVSEIGTRLGAYAKARAKGATIDEATMEARNISIDFSKSGSWGKQINRAVPFFNAGIQDIDLLVGKFKQNPRRTFTRCAVALTIPSIITYAMIRSQDDKSQEYDAMSSSVKNSNWLIPCPKTKLSPTGWLAIPKPYSLGMLFGSLPERMLDFAAHKDPGGIRRWASDFVDKLAPNYMPVVIGQMIEWEANYSFFKGKQIVPNGKINRDDPSKEYNDSTSSLAKFIGAKFGVSPIKVDNLGNNTFTTLYRFGTQGTDGKLDLVKAVMKYPDPYAGNQKLDDYYRHIDHDASVYRQYKSGGHAPTPEESADHAALKDVRKTVEKFQKAIKSAKEDNNINRLRQLNKDLDGYLDGVIKHRLKTSLD